MIMVVILSSNSNHLIHHSPPPRPLLPPVAASDRPLPPPGVLPPRPSARPLEAISNRTPLPLPSVHFLCLPTSLLCQPTCPLSCLLRPLAFAIRSPTSSDRPPNHPHPPSYPRTLCHAAWRVIAAAQSRLQRKSSDKTSASAAYSPRRDVTRGLRTASGRCPRGVRDCWTVEGRRCQEHKVAYGWNEAKRIYAG